MAFEQYEGLEPDEPSPAGKGKANGPGAGNGHAKATNRDRLRLVSIPEMDFLGALANLVKGVFGHRQLVLLFGDSGTAKTLMAVDIALRIALGRAWHGRKVKRGFVVYLSPEGGHSVHLRVKAWCRHHDVAEDEPLFRTVPVSIDLCHDDVDLGDIVANIRELEGVLGPCLAVVIDTVSRALAGGNENGPEDMGGLVRRADRLREALGCTVIAVHHTPANGDEPRGHRALRNAADVRLAATKVGPGLFAVEVRHSRDGEAGAQFLFNLETVELGRDEDGDPIKGALVVETDTRPAGVPGRPAKGKPAERLVRAVQELQRTARDTRRFDFTDDEFAEAVERSGALKGDENDNTRRSVIHRIKLALANERTIAVDGKARTVRLLTSG